MKLFTAMLLGALTALSFGEDSIRIPDTALAGNRGEVKTTPIKKQADDRTTQRRHEELLHEAQRTATATENLPPPTWIAGIAGSAAAIIGLITLLNISGTNRRQLRAYVHIEHPTVSKNYLHEIFSYPIWYTNYGKIPATNFRFSIGIHFTKGLVDSDHAFPELKGNPRAPVGPGQKVQWEHSVEPKRQVNAKFPNDTDVEYLYGKCDYFDGFQNRVTTFRFYRKKGEDWFNADSVGNDAT